MKAGREAFSTAGVWSVLAAGLTAVAFWPVLIELVTLWRDTDRPYSHGALVGPIAAWLTVRACLRAPIAESLGSWLALALFIGSSIVWLAALSGQFLAVQELLFPVLLILAVAAVAGWSMARQVTFPIGYLYLAVPIWSLVVPILQAVTVGVVGFAVGLLEVPVFVEGDFITIPEGVFQISDGCAGLHYFIVALTLSSLYSYLNYQRLAIRVGFVVIAAFLAILSNWIRVGSLVLFGHYTDMQHYLITHEHYYYGWMLYALMLIPTVMIGRFLLGFDARLDSTNGTPLATNAVASARWSTWRPRVVVAGASLALLLAALQFPVFRILGDPAPRQISFIELPPGTGGWRLTDQSASDWQPHFSGADASVSGIYVRSGAQVDAFMAVYLTQSSGRELVGSDNRFFDDGRLISAETLPIAGLDMPMETQQSIVRVSAGSERLIWSWYSVGRQAVATGTEAKIRQLLRGLLGHHSGAVVLISSACVPDCRGAGDLLEQFLRHMGPALATTAVEYQIVQ